MGWFQQKSDFPSNLPLRLVYFGVDVPWIGWLPICFFQVKASNQNDCMQKQNNPSNLQSMGFFSNQLWTSVLLYFHQTLTKTLKLFLTTWNPSPTFPNPKHMPFVPLPMILCPISPFLPWSISYMILAPRKRFNLSYYL